MLVQHTAVQHRSTVGAELSGVHRAAPPHATDSNEERAVTQGAKADLALGHLPATPLAQSFCVTRTCETTTAGSAASEGFVSMLWLSLTWPQ